MKIMGSMPQLQHEHAGADKAQKLNSPSTATTLKPMALDCKSNPDQLTTSITNALANIDLSTTQSPTRQTDDTTNRPTNNSLPVELWMRVFEFLHNTKDYARPPVVAVYKSSLGAHGDSIEAAQTLPPFEKRTWKQTRTLYHIDRTSRAAALKLNLCLRLLEECKAPWPALKTMAKVAHIRYYRAFVPAKPEYLAIEVTEQPELWGGYMEAGRVVRCLSSRNDDVVVHALGLGSAKRIVLLDRCNWDTCCMLARAREIEHAMYRFWKRKGVKPGVIEIV
jgi:hypothetical protein